MSPESNSNKETISPKSIGTPYLPAPESEEGDRTSNVLKVGKQHTFGDSGKSKEGSGASKGGN